MASQKTYKLVTVNNAPERAKRLVGRVIEDLKDQYSIVHAGNAESPEAAKSVLEDIVPDVVFTASMWSPEQSSEVFEAARKVNPNVKTLAIPQGLQVEKGPDAVVEFIKEQLPVLLKA
ncbi:hypothetical protein LTR97_004152 [Elasticomyces elasticus]|uniref:Uncharacterized protein n=1 Tax=Elasticomyces elasticus TaxID=574655 RepID=A0AAN8A4A2_9PEZI|nr:hypothetical protein LTR97_004152 [Elasticomyces elasticus]KAK5730163.1 hypothetical protein LTR15_000097 [Elasticomyces elasticus]